MVPKQASWVNQKIFKAKKYFEEDGYSEEDVIRMQHFKVKEMYLKKRGQYTKVTWRRIIWNNASLPKWIFVGFLAAHRRLQTRDRLKAWGCVEEETCPLCKAEAENIDHLFFMCPFSMKIWVTMLRWMKINRPVMDWNHELTWAEQHCGGKAKAEIYRMTLTGSIYYIWQERNSRIFKGVESNAEAITRSLVQDIHGRGIGESGLNA
ncbi:PREDICTED: uncharacterized protein LOC109231641 [Nicotiana attenuata]|uniref:uncharacterized protein LOC109231641 n=1 Tax=Nicotiana attenuata TaxID=49451 RepID=UPI000904BB17|nr:PREDICTED: uncharacterized protein LOC109231641 [Nicotiana attenuata]